jgi:hypothetical protein
MGNSDIFAVVLIGSVVLAALIYFIIKSNGKNNRVISLLQNHSSQIKILLNREKDPAISALSEDDIKIMLSFSDSDWQDWDELLKRVSALANQFPYSVYEFINEYIPSVKDRNFYKKYFTVNMTIYQKVNIAIASMILDELRIIDADSEETWKQRDNLRQLANIIQHKYSEGYKTYCEIHRLKRTQNHIVVKDKNHIAELQKLYDECKGYIGWEKKQEEFSTTYLKILKDVRSQDGRYPYNVPFNKPNRRGLLEESKFILWQGFCEHFSSFLLDRQTNDFKINFSRISEYGRKSRYFYDRVYDDIFDIINKFDEAVTGSLYVIFIDRCKHNWSKETYDYHYSHLRELLSETDIHYFNFSELPLLNDNGQIGGIFVFDFITSNDELMNNCKLIVEHIKKSVPLIGYYSMIKEYDEEELLELAENNERYLLPKKEVYDENEYIEYLRSCILQVKKAARFSFLAIPNVWIGSAVGAENTKKTWLNNPDSLRFRTKRKKGMISGEYSIDGGANYEEISIEGDVNDIDDIAHFTYRLFQTMGVLSQFKENGQKAIEYMNMRGFLSRN